MALTLAPTLAAFAGSPRVALDRLAALRFRHVQLSATQPGLKPRELGRSARRDLAALLRRLEISAAGLDLWIPPGHYVDPRHADRAVAAVMGAIELASVLGRCPVSLRLSETGGGEPLDSVVKTIGQGGLHHGVEVADHSVPPAQGEGIGVGIDPVAWLIAGEDPVAAISAHAGRLISVRLADLSTTGARAPIGGQNGGRLELDVYRQAIATSGHHRPLVVDLRDWVDPWRGLEQTAGAWGGG